MLELRLLGPVEVGTADGPVPAGEPRRLAVLAALAVDAGQVVPVATLIDRVWGDAPPAQAGSSLRAYLTRIRRVLEQVSDRAGTVTVARQAGGYRLDAPADAIDLLRFRKLVERAGGEAGDRERADLLRQALGLWRGEPLGGVAGEWAARTREQLVGERLTAAVTWAGAELALGNVSVVLAPLASLSAEHPLMEPLVEAHVRALVAAGRPTEALERCRAHRQQLAESYGTDQGPRLRALYETILRGDEPVDRAPGPPVGADHGVRPAAVPDAAPADPADERGPVRRRPRPGRLALVAAGSGLLLALVVGVAWAARVPGQRTPPATLPTTPVSEPVSAPVPGAWVEQFSEDLDREQWGVQDDQKENGSAWSPGMVRVSGGELEVRGVGRNPTGQGNMSGSVCWCAHRATAPIRRYGVWEARAKFDAGGGYGDILGLYPNSGEGPYLTLARLNDAARTSMYPEMQDAGGHTVVGPSVPGDFTDWHTYGVEWRPDFFTFSLDRRVIFDSRTHRKPLGNPTGPMFFYVTVDSGPDGPIPGPGRDTPSTVAAHIDWVSYHP